jgi:hypothetical protein
MHQVSKILFCHETKHVSGIFCAHHQELSAVHVAICMFHGGYVAAARRVRLERILLVICTKIITMHGHLKIKFLKYVGTFQPGL